MKKYLPIDDTYQEWQKAIKEAVEGDSVPNVPEDHVGQVDALLADAKAGLFKFNDVITAINEIAKNKKEIAGIDEVQKAQLATKMATIYHLNDAIAKVLNKITTPKRVNSITKQINSAKSAPPPSEPPQLPVRI